MHARSTNEGDADGHHVREEAEGDEKEHRADPRTLGARPEVDAKARQQEAYQEARSYLQGVPHPKAILHDLPK
jgi:hypothetical protein